MEACYIKRDHKYKLLFNRCSNMVFKIHKLYYSFFLYYPNSSLITCWNKMNKNNYVYFNMPYWSLRNIKPSKSKYIRLMIDLYLYKESRHLVDLLVWSLIVKDSNWQYFSH